MLDYTSMKVFGCLLYASSPNYNWTKPNPRYRKYVHLEYKPCVKGHILYDFKNKQIFISRDTIFYENIFPTTYSLQIHPVP